MKKLKEKIVSIFKKQTRGFTLVEALVAISILTIAVTGAFGVAQSGLQSSFYARDQMTAFYLAQEAIELVKNRRHTNILADDHWLDGLVEGPPGGFCTGSSTCRADSTKPDSQVFSNCGGGLGGNCAKLYSNSDGFYTHESSSGNEETRFRRVLTISNQVHYAEVTAFVRWTTQGGSTRDFEITENIFRWHGSGGD